MIHVILTSFILPALVSALTVLVIDRFSSFFYKQRYKKEIKQQAPKILHRRYNFSRYSVPKNKDYKFYLNFITKPDSMDSTLVFDDIDDTYQFDCSIILIRIINNTNDGITISNILDGRKDKLIISNNWQHVDIEPNTNVSIYAKSDPPPISELHIIFKGYLIKYPISKHIEGYVQPKDISQINYKKL